MPHPLLWVDAFTREPLAGNPCAIVLDAQDLEPRRMQAIAREMNLSETVFVIDPGDADFAARYFTPGEEIPMAGHPTIALMVALVDAGRIALDGDRTVRLALPAGTLDVDLLTRAGALDQVVMQQLAPEFGRRFEAERVTGVLGLESADLADGCPLEIVSTGTPQLMVPVREASVLDRIRIDGERFGAFRREGGFFSVHVFSWSRQGAEATTVARHFGVPPDWREDPYTGSATGGMGAYLWRHGLIEAPRFRADQGAWMDRPGSGSVEVLGPRDAISGVRVGGPGVVVSRGELAL